MPFNAATQARRRCRQPLVQRPQHAARRQPHAGQQTHIDIANPQPVQGIRANKTEHFFGAGHAGLGQVLQGIKDHGTLLQAAQSTL